MTVGSRESTVVVIGDYDNGNGFWGRSRIWLVKTDQASSPEVVQAHFSFVRFIHADHVHV